MIDLSKISLFASFILFIWLFYYLFKTKILNFVDVHIKDVDEKVRSTLEVKEKSFEKLQAEKQQMAILSYELHKIELEMHDTIEKYSNELKDKTKSFLAYKQQELSLNMEKIEKSFEHSLQNQLIDSIFQKVQQSIQTLPSQNINYFLNDHIEAINKGLHERSIL